MPSYHKCEPYDLVLPDGSKARVEVEISSYTPVVNGRILSNKTQYKVESVKYL